MAHTMSELMNQGAKESRPKICRYNLIGCYSLDDLIDRVNELMDQDKRWTPTGTPFYAHNLWTQTVYLRAKD